MQTIEQRTLSIDTAGADGAAVGSGSIDDLYGFLLDIYLNFHASAPATTDTTVAYSDPALGNIVVLTSSVTDVLLAPRKTVCDAAAGALAAYDLCPLNGSVSISLAQCNALTGAVAVTLSYIRM